MRFPCVVAVRVVAALMSSGALVSREAPSEGQVAQAPAQSTGGMAKLPGGTYTMGETKRTVTVAPFLLDVTEVTAGAQSSRDPRRQIPITSPTQASGKTEEVGGYIIVR
jgi:hypothetical protein